MKYKHVKGLQLQKPAYLKLSNLKIRQLLAGEEVQLNKENVEEFESLGVQVIPIEEKPKKKIVKE